MRFFVGIDIGKSGAYYILNEKRQEVERGVMPMIKKNVDWHGLNRIISKYKDFDVLVLFEKLNVIFGSSKKTAFSMGEQYGAVRMACVANAIPYMEVPPKTWQKDIFEGQVKIIKTGSKSALDTKAMALEAARRLYPSVNLLASERSTKPHDGIIDALLIAEYGRRKYPH